jgi:hypothetical protein
LACAPAFESSLESPTDDEITTITTIAAITNADTAKILATGTAW